MKEKGKRKKIQKALEQEKALFKKTWASSSTSTKRHKPSGKAAPTNRDQKMGKFSQIKREYHTSGKPAYSKRKWYNNKK